MYIQSPIQLTCEVLVTDQSTSKVFFRERLCFFLLVTTGGIVSHLDGAGGEDFDIYSIQNNNHQHQQRQRYYAQNIPPPPTPSGLTPDARIESIYAFVHSECTSVTKNSLYFNMIRFNQQVQYQNNYQDQWITKEILWMPLNHAYSEILYCNLDRFGSDCVIYAGILGNTEMRGFYKEYVDLIVNLVWDQIRSSGYDVYDQKGNILPVPQHDILPEEIPLDNENNDINNNDNSNNNTTVVPSQIPAFNDLINYGPAVMDDGFTTNTDTVNPSQIPASPIINNNGDRDEDDHLVVLDPRDRLKSGPVRPIGYNSTDTVPVIAASNINSNTVRQKETQKDK